MGLSARAIMSSGDIKTTMGVRGSAPALTLAPTLLLQEFRLAFPYSSCLPVGTT